MPVSRPLKERFDEKWTPEPFSGCWLWIAHCNPSGYGVIGTPRQRSCLKAHRVAWEIYRGPISPGISVLHTCDVRCCVNPAHLFLGTQSDNVSDCIKKGRFQRGERNGLSKLANGEIRLIRSSKKTNREIAREFGIGKSNVSSIRRLETWAHV